MIDELNAFIDELKADIIRAKAIEQKEQDSFFSNYTVQDVNVTTLLTSAKTNAATLIDKFQSAELSQKFTSVFRSGRGSLASLAADTILIRTL